MNASSLYRALFIRSSWRLISIFFVPGGRGEDCCVRASWMIFLTSAPVTFSPVLARSTTALAAVSGVFGAERRYTALTGKSKSPKFVDLDRSIPFLARATNVHGHRAPWLLRAFVQFR